jgi:hypothetical protein
MATLSTELALSLQLVAVGTTTGFGSIPGDRITATISDSLADGSGLDAANLYYAPATYTITTGADQDIDLSSAAVNGIGQTVAFTKIKAILIHNTTETAGYEIKVGGAPSNPFISWLMASGDGVKIGPNGVMCLWNPSLAGYATAAGSSDILRINNPNAGSVVVKVLIVGIS